MVKQALPLIRKKILLSTTLPVLAAGIIISLIFVHYMTPPIFSYIEERTEAELKLASGLGLDICEGHINYLMELRLDSDSEMMSAVKTESIEEIKAISMKLHKVNLLVIDDSGTVLGSSTGLSQKTLSLSKEPQTDGRIIRQEIGGEPARTHSLYLPLWRWHIVSFIYEKDYLTPISLAKKLIYLGTFGVSIAVVIALFIVFNRLVAIPIQKIIDATNSAAQGHLGKIEIKRQDEIGQVAIAFNGMVESINAMMIDLRESENKFRNFSEHSLVGINLIQDGVFVYVNPKFANIFGYTVGECLNGLKMTNLIHPDDLAIVQEQISKRVSGEIDQVHYEFKGVRKTGETVHLEIFGSSVIFNGKPASTATILDITGRKQADIRLEETLERLRKAVGTTVQVMAAAVEARDPYTAGHQIRSANIARAIANEMGLPQDKIEGIRIAGSIHDIGKIALPAEILSKPTKLSTLEFALIKEHAARGFEMLKDVESPWPLAEIVYQHHEKMDGSGYPRGLKGEEICIEARILTIADVVEAMASHRPYRPGLGIDAALNEIEKNKGVYYDSAVADACLAMFREGRFLLEGV